MHFKDILKLFFLDWLVTLVMYLVGYVFSGIGNLEKADIVFQIFHHLQKALLP